MFDIRLTSILALASLNVLTAVPARSAESPPKPGPPRTITFPTPSEMRLENGLRVIVLPRHNVPLIAVGLIVKTGSEMDPPSRSGVANLVAAMVEQSNTDARTGTQAAKEIDSLGAQINSDVGPDTSIISGFSMTHKFARLFPIFGDVVQHPVFDSYELEALKTPMRQSLQRTYTDPRQLAEQAVQRVLYRHTAYGSPKEGTLESLGNITEDDITHFYEAYYRPENSILIFGGDITPERAFEYADRVFGDWIAPPASRPSPLFIPTPRHAPLVVVVDKPDSGRTAIAVGWLGIERESQDFYTALVAGTVLSGPTGRLNQEIRMKRGLTYFADASFEPRRRPGPLIAMTLVDPSKAAESASLLLDTVFSLKKERVSDEELKLKKAALLGEFGMDTEEINGLIAQAGTLASYDIPLSELNRYMPQVEAVTPEQIQKLAAEKLTDDVSMVLVGDSKQFIEDLRKRFPLARVVRFSDLDLNETALVKTFGY
jgi:zinc protease